MISDQRRTDAYREALLLEASGLVVADIGAGTGVLSLMAAEAGAKLIYAVEASQIAKVCKRQVKDKNLGNVIKVMNCRAEIAPLAKDSVDLIISEWQGYFLLFERMLPSVLSVRDRCLK